MPPRTRTKRPRAAIVNPSSEPDVASPTPPPPVKTIINVTNTKKAKSAVTTTVTLTAAQEREEEEDAMFMRNRNRTAQKWKQLEKRIEKIQSPTKVKNRGLERDRSLSPTSRKNRPKAKPMPEWTKATNLINVLSSEDDSDVEILESNEQTPRKAADTTPRPAAKRKRARSRSLTPPPPMPASELQETRAKVRLALGLDQAEERSESPTATAATEDLFEGTDLPPEFAAIAANAKSRAAKAGAGASSSNGREASTSTASTVNLKVRWNPHPQDTLAKAHAMGFVMQRTDSFSELFESIADEVNALSDNLVVTYDGKRVFPASTPSGIGIWSEATLDAYTTHTYEFMRANRVERALSVDVEAPPFTVNPQNANTTDEFDGTASQSESESQDTFKLTIRSGTTEITVTVRPQTTCGAIVASFVKRTCGNDGGAKAKAARIEFDGEKMRPEMTVGQIELEDGDVVDILGL